MKQDLSNLMNRRWYSRKSLLGPTFSLITLFLLLPFQNCADQNLEFVQQNTDLQYALVYDGTESDQALLSNKVQGYSRPSLNQIFNQWSRVSGPFFYQRQSDIIPEPQFSFCFTTLNEFGNWTPGFNPNTNTNIANPGSNGACINSASFGAASWSYLSASNSLRCATNAGNFVGFVSGVPFDSYENEAVLTSQDGDDDVIALIIASTVDSQGNVHVLTASRSHGGAGANLGWGIVYYRNGARAAVLSNISVGGIYKNPSSGPRTPETNGWSGKKSLIKVIRNKNLITAYASDWYMGEVAPELTEASKVEIDLDDPTYNGNYNMFKGPHKYGYGTQSQLGATFQNIKFTSLVDAKYLFDLANNRAYKLIEDGSGRYEQLSNSSAFKKLGVNLHVVNPETQKAFFLWSRGRFKEVDGDKLHLNNSEMLQN